MSWIRSRAVGLVVALTLAFGAGYGSHAWLAPAASGGDTGERVESFGVFWEAWELAKTEYVLPEDANDREMTYGAIAGMLDSLGDEGHTRFLAPEELEQWRQSLAGNFVGIGVEINVRDGQPVVVAPIPGSPAVEAGIQPGDLIVAIDGRSTAGLSLAEIGPLIRGPAGTSVTLTLRQPTSETTRTVTVERREIALPLVTWAMAPGTTFAHVRVSQFADGTHAALLAALGEARAAGATGLILDLRNNPGGFLHEAVATTSEFLEGGTILLMRTRDGARVATADANGSAGAATDIPLVVLVNPGSASSAEVMSGALQDHERAVVIGERTAGTGTVLSTYTLSDGSAVLLGTALWLTPDGRSIRDEGIQPDIVVPLPLEVSPLRPTETRQLTPEELRASDDHQLLRAIERLEGRAGP